MRGSCDTSPQAAEEEEEEEVAAGRLLLLLPFRLRRRRLLSPQTPCPPSRPRCPRRARSARRSRSRWGVAGSRGPTPRSWQTRAKAAEVAEGSLRASRSMEPRSVSEGAAAARTEEEGRAGRRRCPRRAVAAVAPAALLARHGVDIIGTCLSSISSFFPQRSVGSLLGIAAELISLSGSFERERTQGEPRARESGPRRKLAKSSDPPKPKPKAAALILLLARPGPLLFALVS